MQENIKLAVNILISIGKGNQRSRLTFYDLNFPQTSLVYFVIFVNYSQLCHLFLVQGSGSVNYDLNELLSLYFWRPDPMARQEQGERLPQVEAG